MRSVMPIVRFGAAGLQLAAALLWALPQPAAAAPVLILPQVTFDRPFWLGVGGGLPRQSFDGADLILAQTSGCGRNCPSQSYPSDSSTDAGPQAITPEATRRIVRLFTEASDYCHLLKLRYRIDCLHAQFSGIAQGLPQTGDYRALRQLLVRAANRLEDVVDRYEDRSAHKVSPRPTLPDAPRMRPLSPIRPEQQEAANQATEAVITELTTALLRSSTGSQRRQLAFQEIATAIDSTKVLLRSA